MPKNKICYFSTLDSFCLIASHMLILSIYVPFTLNCSRETRDKLTTHLACLKHFQKSIILLILNKTLRSLWEMIGLQVVVVFLERPQEGGTHPCGWHHGLCPSLRPFLMDLHVVVTLWNFGYLPHTFQFLQQSTLISKVIGLCIISISG